MAKNPSRRGTQTKQTEHWQSQRQVKRIDILPDDVLLDIFDFYMNEYSALVERRAHAWLSLVHVCQQWRSLVFQSPRRLNLQLYCTPRTPVKDTLGIWPAFPLIIHGSMDSTSGTDNIIAALRKSNRVCNVELHLAGWQLEEVLAAMMQVPFPELTNLQLWSHDTTPPVIPDSFLDGSAPRLRHFELDGIPFPGLPKMFLSATHLVSLNLSDIPHSGYISPEKMVAPLFLLSSLEVLSLGFRSPQSLPDLESRSLPRLKPSVLPVLRRLHFKGVTEYLEELVTCIDTPQLDGMNITFFNQIDFACTRLAQFINCTPKLRARDEAHVQFDDRTAGISLRNRTYNRSPRVHELLINISCREPDWQLSSIEQVCNSLHPLSTPEDLYIEHEYSQLVWKSGAIEDILWLELLRPFATVENLYLSKEFAPGIALALQELAGITEVLPKLRNIFVEGFRPLKSFQEDTGQFVAARRLFGHPIAISGWKLLKSTVKQVLTDSTQFRILVVGKRGSGKSSLINSTFRVGMLAAPDRGSDINSALRPDNNHRLIVHEYSGLEPGDASGLRTIQDFITNRTDPTCAPAERLHAIWICVSTSDAIDGSIGEGIGEILSMRRVPVVVAFTKSDLAYPDISGSEYENHQYQDRTRTRAYAQCEELCRSLFCREAEDVPAELVSVKPQYGALINNLIVTTDRFIMGSHTTPSLSNSQGTKPRIAPTPLAWSIALRVSRDITIQASIEIGRSQYWRNLWSSLNFAKQPLKSCMNIIHIDIINIWNLYDRRRYLSSNQFKINMSHFVKDLATPAGGAPPSDWNISGDKFADWVDDVYRGSQEDVRCVMGYIVNITAILDAIFGTAGGNVTENATMKAMVTHIRSGRRDSIHQDIRSFVTETFSIRSAIPEKDLVLEKIISLIRRYCFPQNA